MKMKGSLDYKHGISLESKQRKSPIKFTTLKKTHKNNSKITMHTKKLLKTQIETKTIFRKMDQISPPNEAHGRNF